MRLTVGSTSLTLHSGDAAAVMQTLAAESIDVAFADPPYFLSGSGSTCRSGTRARVHKGDWDAPRAAEYQHLFAVRWLAAMSRLLRPSGSLFVSGTSHSIRHVHRAAVDTLGWSLINDIVWAKPNPPPNLACTTLTHASETILWLRPPGRRPGETFFAYAAAKAITGKQMRSVWTDIAAPGRAERSRGGGHPTQKPLALLERVMLLALPAGGAALDPFLGSGTTLEAAVLAGAAGFTGIDLEARWIRHAARRARSAQVVAA